MKRIYIIFLFFISFLLSSCTSNPQLLAEVKPFYQGQKAVINKNCSSCSYRIVKGDGRVDYKVVSAKDEDSYTIKDVKYASLFDAKDPSIGYYLVAENDTQVQNREAAIKKDNVKEDTFEMNVINFSFPVNEYRFPISESQLKNHELPNILDREGYKKKLENDRKKQAEEKRRLAEKNKEINEIKNALHSNGCNQYWDYIYSGKPFIDYLVNLKINKDNQVYCKKNVNGMDIFVYVKSPHHERDGVGLIADSSDKTLYRKSWEEFGEVNECNMILCKDPLGFDDLEALLLFSLM